MDRAIEFVEQCNEFHDQAGDLRLLGQAMVLASAPLIQKGDLSRFVYSQETAYLTAAEGGSGAHRDQWLPQAHHACRDLLNLGKTYRAYLPEVLLLRGRCEWLRGRTDQAQRHWHSSLAEAETLAMRYDPALAYFELGYRLGNCEHLEKAESLFSEIGAEFDAAKAREHLLQ